MVEFGFGVAATLIAEFLIAHFFLWLSKRGVQTSAAAVVVAAESLPSEAMRDAVKLEGFVKDLFPHHGATVHPTPVPAITPAADTSSPPGPLV